MEGSRGGKNAQVPKAHNARRDVGRCEEYADASGS